MAKNKSSMTVVTGKTLSNLIDLQQSTQDALNKITASMQDASDKKDSTNQQIMLELTRKLVDTSMDNLKLTKKSADLQSKNFEVLSKGAKDWKTWGDKMKDLKSSMSDKFSADSLQKKLLKGLNIGGILNQKLMALDFKKTAKITGQAEGLTKKDLDKAANEFATNTIAAMRANAKIERMKQRTGKDDDFLKNTPAGAKIYKARDDAATTANNIQKSPKDVTNKMGGNTMGISVPLVSAEQNPLSSLGNPKETQMEAAQLQQQQTEFLQRIADNTDTMAGNGINKDAGKKNEIDSDNNTPLSGMLDSLMAMFSSRFLKVISNVFSIRGILRVVTKFFAPAMIIGSLVNGIMDGFKAWQDTGSIQDAIVAALGGILEFISFGLFDKDMISSIVSAVSGFVDTFITQPLTDFVSALGDSFDTYISAPIKDTFAQMMDFFQNIGQLFSDYVSDPIKNAFQPIKDFFADMIDSVLGTLKSIEIPGVNFKLPFKDDPIQIGPWHPFDVSNNSSQAVQAPTPSTGQLVMNASKVNADEQAMVEGKKAQTPVQNINTNVSSNSSSNQIIKTGARNQESSQSKYLGARYA